MNLNATREEVYHAQTRVWDRYKSRAFATFMTMAENSIWSELGHDLPPIVPLWYQVELFPINENCMNEENIIEYNYDWDNKNKKKDSKVERKEDGWIPPVYKCEEFEEDFRVAKTENEAWKEKWDCSNLVEDEILQDDCIPQMASV